MHFYNTSGEYSGLTIYEQVRVYEQLLELRQKMASRLSETNRHARFLEGELSVCNVLLQIEPYRLPDSFETDFPLTFVPGL
jgi:hypothetical protein